MKLFTHSKSQEGKLNLTSKTTGRILCCVSLIKEVIMDKKEIRKNEIIRDSINVMHLKGYNSTSVNDIAVAAGIPKGSFYNYFKNKEHYAVDAIEYYKNIMTEDWRAFLSKQEFTPLEGVVGFFENAIDMFLNNEYKLGCFVGNLAQEMGDISEAISSAVATFYCDIVGLVLEELSKAKESGELTTEVDLSTLASYLISSWQGALLRSKGARDRQVLEDFLTVINSVILI